LRGEQGLDLTAEPRFARAGSVQVVAPLLGVALESGGVNTSDENRLLAVAIWMDAAALILQRYPASKDPV
jgi:hypothetical protein